jgi:hypothetical protein
MMFDFVLFASIIYSFQEHLAAQRKERERWQLQNWDLKSN